jgi:hypothetical protein
VPKFTMDGSLAYEFAVLTDVKVSGEITFEHDTAVNGTTGEKANWRNEVPRLLALRFAGSNLTTGGTDHQTKALHIDLPIKWKKFNPLSDIEGNDTVVGTFESRYNEVLGSRGSITIVSEHAALA